MNRRPALYGIGIQQPAVPALRRMWAPLLAIALWAATVACAGAADILRYGGDRDFRPFEFLDDTGRPQGFQIELLGELARLGGFQVSVRLDDWKNIETDFRAGKLDAVAMADTRTRRQWAAFARPHATPAMAIYHRVDGRAPMALAELAGHTLAVQDSEPMGDTRADFFSGDQYRFSVVPTPLAALEAVRDARADYALMPRAYGDAAIAAGSVQGVAASDFSLRLQAYGFAVAPGNVGMGAVVEFTLEGDRVLATVAATGADWAPTTPTERSAAGD